MNSTFMGLAIATRGLIASQGGLAVTSTNISNANTEGYTRQTVNQTAAGPAAVYNGRACIGSGAQVNSIDRVRDTRLDQKYWQENQALGEWETKADALNEIEEIFGEPSSNGFSTTMNGFYSALEDLSKDPSSASARENVKEEGVSVCKYLNDEAHRLSQLRQDTNSTVKTNVEEINSYTTQIAELNKKIRQAASVSADTNALEDERVGLIDKLSKLTKVSANEIVVGKQPDGTEDKILSINVDGQTLVSDGEARKLECYEIQDGSNQNGMYGVRWQDTGESFNPSNGALKGALDIRDGTGNGGEYEGVCYCINQLDKLSRTFAKAFNEGVFLDGNSYYAGHAGGVGADGSTGIRFFSFDGKSSAALIASGTDIDTAYNNVIAANISLSQDIQDDFNKIAASSATGGSENNQNISDIIKLCKDTRLFNKGNPEDFMNSIVSTLGTGSSYAQRNTDNLNKVVKNVNDRRMSVSGVSVNEETGNLTKYEQAYDASSQMVNVWNSIYKETINLISD